LGSDSSTINTEVTLKHISLRTNRGHVITRVDAHLYDDIQGAANQRSTAHTP
jgi:hypothetical protein